MVTFSTECELCRQICVNKIFLPCGHSLCSICCSIHKDTISSLCPIQEGCLYPGNSSTESLGYLLSKVGGLSNLKLLVSRSLVCISESEMESTSLIDNTVIYHEGDNNFPATATNIHHGIDTLEESNISKVTENSVEQRENANDHPLIATESHSNLDTLVVNSINEADESSREIVNSRYDSAQCDSAASEKSTVESYWPQEFNLMDSSTEDAHMSSQTSSIAQALDDISPVVQAASEYSPDYAVVYQSGSAPGDDKKSVLNQSSNCSKSRKKKGSAPLGGALSDEPQNKKQKRQSDPSKDKDAVWMSYYYKVLDYGERNKHLNIPKDECVEDDGFQYKLGAWLNRQRTNLIHHVTAEKEEFLLYLVTTYGLWMDDSKVAYIVANFPQNEDTPDANCSSSALNADAERKCDTASSISSSNFTNNNNNSNSNNNSNDSNSILIGRDNAAHVSNHISRPVTSVLPPDNNADPSKLVGNKRILHQPKNKNLQQSAGTLAATANTIVDEKPEPPGALLTKRVSAKATPPEVISIADTKPSRPQGMNSLQKIIPQDFSELAHAAQPKSPDIVERSAVEKSQKEVPKVSLRNLVTVKTEGTPSPYAVDSRHLPDHRLLSPPMPSHPIFGVRQPPFPSQPPPPPPPPPPAFPPPLSLTRQHLQLNNEQFSPSPPSVSSKHVHLQSHADQQIHQPLQPPTQISQPNRPQQPPPLPPPPPQHSLQATRSANAQQSPKPSPSISEGDYIGFVYILDQGAMLEYGMGKVYSISGSGKSLSYEVLQLKPCWDGTQALTVETYVHLHFALEHDEILTVNVDQLHDKNVYKIPLQPDGQLSTVCRRLLQRMLSSFGTERKICFM